MKALCIHGVGKHDPNVADWQTHWRSAVQTALGLDTEIAFCTHDDLFITSGLTWSETWAAIQTLGGSWWSSRAARGWFDGDNPVGWTAGMVTQWAGKPELREQARDRLRAAIAEHEPDILLGHSLGSLIAYDLFAHEPDLLSGKVFVSFGSQINNSFVQGVFEHADGEKGVYPLPPDTLWVHLYNSHDWMFTADLRLDLEGARNFRQFAVPFNGGWLGSHTNIDKYLNEPRAHDAWPVVQDWLAATGPQRAVRGVAVAAEKAVAKPVIQAPRRKRRALLIGINEYQSAKVPPLQGCANDVFLISSTLQETGFKPDEIRVVLNDRATKQGIQTRLDWLFEDVRAGDVRLLYYSGHGVRLPVYNEEGEPDRLLEALVPHDFDGTRPLSITDRDLAEYYRQVPFEASLIFAFDCCHAAGLAPSGQGGRGRPVDLPDDVRHRMLRWNPIEGMWEMRHFPQLMPLSGKETKAEQEQRIRYTGAAGCTERLGRSVVRRRLPNDEYDALRKATDWKGPYLPMILEACGEEQLAEEYPHGMASYGAFTYALCHVLREARQKQEDLTFTELVAKTQEKLTRLRYVQTPAIIGPTAFLKTKVPLLVPEEDEKPKAKGKAKKK